jgi:2'-hydroxyisoflavone reductase
MCVARKDDPCPAHSSRDTGQGAALEPRCDDGPVRILILGGTRFLGRAITDAALGRGDTVTLFNRGLSNPGLYPGVETVIGDRTKDLSALDGRDWDAVIDVAGYDPEVVRLSAETFAKRTGRYAFVSTVSVYASQETTEDQREDAPVAQLRPGATSLEETYGPNKALCEQVVRSVYRERSLIGRPGLITGPHDPTDRVAYWPRRIARAGRVLVPGDPGDLVQFIDARDLASFFTDACHAGTAGVFNLTGTPVPFGTFIGLCMTATYSDADLIWIDSDRLVAAGVDPGMGIPLWIGEPGYDAFNDVDSSRAAAVGLETRPVVDTLRDTLSWDLARGGPPADKEGLSAAEEERLLRELAG